MEKNFWQKYDSLGVKVFGIDLQESATLVANWAKNKQLTYTILLEETGNVWKQYGMGYIPHNVVLDDNLVVHYTDYGYAPQQIKDVIESLLAQTKVTRAGQADMPDGFRLEQNYPNPFNGETCISYFIPKQMPVTMKIYSINGGEIVTLINGNQHAGWHVVHWSGIDENGKAVPSGLYIYRLKTPAFTATRKLTYLR